MLRFGNVIQGLARVRAGRDGFRPRACYTFPVMKPQVVFGFYFWFSVPGGREVNV